MDDHVLVHGLPEIQRAFPWKIEQSGVVSRVTGVDELGFFVSKSSRPSMQKALCCVAAKLSRTTTP